MKILCDVMSIHSELHAAIEFITEMARMYVFMFDGSYLSYKMTLVYIYERAVDEISGALCFMHIVWCMSMK